MSEVTLHHGDCLEVMKDIPSGSVDAVITDPAYGIEHVLNWQKKNNYDRFVKMTGNDVDFNPQPFLNFDTVVLFGANYYSNKLPIGGWIVWDKRLSVSADQMFGSPFELAWTNRKGQIMIRVLHGGVVNADGVNQERYHPTQKPVKLMRHIIENFTLVNTTVLDPYMGSGTTGIACIQTGRDFIGIEIDKGYYEVAKKRIKIEQMQLRFEI